MWILIDADARQLRWTESLDELSAREAVQVCSPERGRALLEQLSRDPALHARLQRLASSLEPTNARDARPLDRFGRMLRSQRLRVAEIRRADYYEWGQGEKEATVTEATAKKVAEITYQVVDDESGDPISGVTLFIKVPGGAEMKRQTDGEGTVRIGGLDPGRCAVRAERGAEDLLHVLAFVGFGLGKRGGAGHGPARLWHRPEIDALERAGKRKPKKTPTAIAVVLSHRVKTGETLESIAKAYDLERDELVKFNFGTTERDEVQRHLRREVGCRKRHPKTGDYELTSRDKPGILYVPRTWEAPNQHTDNDYVIRVRPIAPHEPTFVLSA